MSLINKIKEFFKGKEEKSLDVPIKESSLEEVPLKLEEESKEITTSKKQLKERLYNNIKDFELKIDDVILSLEEIDISEKKEHDKIKLVVNENLNQYITYLKRTIENLKKIDLSDPEKIIHKISGILNEFRRLSHMPFEKATILVGEKLGNAKITVNSFIKEINSVFEENKKLFEKDKLFKKINILMNELKNRKYLFEEIDLELKELHNKMEGKKAECSSIKYKISKIRQSEQFNKDNIEKENNKEYIEELYRKINSIKNEINLKELSKKLHEDKKKYKLIMNYIADFKKAIKEDKELQIIEILKSEISEQTAQGLFDLQEIQQRVIELENPLFAKTDYEISSLEKELSKLDANINDIESNIARELKKKEKLHIKIDDINSEILENSKSF